MPGWVYFVRDAEFQAHITDYVDQPEVRLSLHSQIASSFQT